MEDESHVASSSEAFASSSSSSEAVKLTVKEKKAKRRKLLIRLVGARRAEHHEKTGRKVVEGVKLSRLAKGNSDSNRARVSAGFGCFIDYLIHQNTPFDELTAEELCHEDVWRYFADYMCTFAIKKHGVKPGSEGGVKLARGTATGYFGGAKTHMMALHGSQPLWAKPALFTELLKAMKDKITKECNYAGLQVQDKSPPSSLESTLAIFEVLIRRNDIALIASWNCLNFAQNFFGRADESPHLTFGLFSWNHPLELLEVNVPDFKTSNQRPILVMHNDKNPELCVHFSSFCYVLVGAG